MWADIRSYYWCLVYTTVRTRSWAWNVTVWNRLFLTPITLGFCQAIPQRNCCFPARTFTTSTSHVQWQPFTVQTHDFAAHCLFRIIATHVSTTRTPPSHRRPPPMVGRLRFTHDLPSALLPPPTSPQERRGASPTRRRQ